MSCFINSCIYNRCYVLSCCHTIFTSCCTLCSTSSAHFTSSIINNQFTFIYIYGVCFNTSCCSIAYSSKACTSYLNSILCGCCSHRFNCIFRNRDFVCFTFSCTSLTCYSSQVSIASQCFSYYFFSRGCCGLCISNSSFHLAFIHGRRSSCTSSYIFNFCITRIDTICFINNDTTNSDFIEGYILSGTNSNCTTCVRNSDIITINEVNSFSTSYSSCTCAIGFYIPRSCCFCKVLNVSIASCSQVGQVFIRCIFSCSYSGC